MRYALVAQGPVNGATLASAFANALAGQAFDRFDVAVAYATFTGIKELERILGGIPESRWVVGLDDAFTQPQALDYLMALPGAKLRIAKMSPLRRFHPKLYCAWSSTENGVCVSAIGSGNMTLGGLRKNGEAAVVLSADVPDEVLALRQQWETMWNIGEDATQAALDAYRSDYQAARESHQALVVLGVSPPETALELPLTPPSDFAGASVAWLEAGTASAGGRDLEFPRLMMPYFALGQSGETRIFQMGNGELFSLTFTLRTDNQMWRLLLSRDAIQASIGRDTMRPVSGGNRSDVAIIFRKSGGGANYEVQMVVLGSTDHEEILEASKKINAHHRTRQDSSGRNFGYF